MHEASHMAPRNGVYQFSRRIPAYSGERDRGSVLRVLILCRLAFPAVFPCLELVFF
jgi:hypothetical protein